MTSSFDTKKLLCADGQSISCLSADQLSALDQIFSGYYEGDRFVYGPILPSGGEAALAVGELSNGAAQLGIDYYRYFVLK